MKVLSVGEFKSQFSDVVKDVRAGEEVSVSYGKKKEKIGVFVPYSNYYEKKPKRKLGLWEGKASVRFAKDFKMTVDEFLNLNT